MKANCTLVLSMMIAILWSCETKQNRVPLVGTWQLISARTAEKDTSFSTFDATHKFIKIINLTHFAFLNHGISSEKDSAATAFTAGGGKYTLADSVYTEHLDYYVDKQWENNEFKFVVKITGDTLVQKGVEKVAKLGIDRVITETYIRVND